MRLLLTVGQATDQNVDHQVDLAVDVDGTTTVADLIDTLDATEAGHRAGTAVLVRRTGHTIPGSAVVAESNIRSGDLVDVIVGDDVEVKHEFDNPLGSRAAGQPVSERPGAVVKLLTGPMANTAIEIPFGETTIGRGEDNDLVVSDDSMSRQHGIITVDDNTVSIIDRGSTNGIVVGGQLGHRAVNLLPGKRVLLGSTWLEVEHCRRSRALADLVTPIVEFNRPPRLVPPFKAGRVVLPDPPNHPQKPRLPYLSALAPLAMAAGMVYSPLLFGGQPNFRYGIFMLFSPLMVLASFIERKRGGRVEFKEALARFRTAIVETEQQLEAARSNEQQGRNKAAPSVLQLGDAIDQLSPRMWERALDDPDALSLRIGLADQPSIVEIVDQGKGPADLRREVEALPARFAVVPQVPALASLPKHGGVGVSGPSEFVVPLCYSLVAQVAALHSPAEVLLTAMVPDGARDDWAWMKWLPHCPADQSPLGGNHLAATDLDCRSLLSRLLELVEHRMGEQRAGFGDGPALVAPTVVVVIAEGVPVVQHELTRLLEDGPKVGIFPLWISGASRRVPRAIGNVVEVSPDGTTASLGFAGTDRIIDDIAIEALSHHQAIDVARRMAPIDDVSAKFTEASQIPNTVSLVDLLGGVDVMESTAPIHRNWQGRPKHLTAPVGRTADGTFTLDIRNDGPHGLVGGTTGAGKSEFLQTWIMSMATTFSPETVTFLLVDYKGGAAFKDCSRLPHSVGMVTDLDPAGIMRALISLGAEVRRREILQDKHNCSSLLDMIDKGIPEAPPSLLIIVDEFAALVQEVPEFIEGMVDIAQRGRSLGVHLILATQRPAGVITGQIKANTDLRVALRTSDTEDSSDVIESPAAADIDRNTPGRAITRIGRKRTQFQTAYVGGVTDGDQAEVEVAMARFEFDGLSPLETTTVKPPGESNVPTDLERLVDNLGDAFAQTGRPLPRRPWLDPLQSLYNLTALAEAAEGDLTLGMVDHPDEQAQVPFHFRLDTDGSLGVIGSGGSGKTVTLRTIAASAALMADEADELPIVYGLDFAGRGLQMLEEMPHVAGVVADDDPERVRRVMADLELLLEERTRLSAEARASSFPELRRATTSPIQRRILLIDGYPAFHQMFENVEGDRWINIVRRLILEGRQYGLHVVISAARRELIYSTVARAVSRWVVLRQTSVDDYRNLEVPVDLLGEEPDPGRAIVGRNLAQIAILGDRSETADQVNAIKTLAEDLRQKGVPDAPPIRLLPVEVSRRDLVDRRALGLRDRDFSQWTMPDDFRIFLIAGPRSSGKTAALVAAGRAVTEGNQDPDPNLQVVYLTPKPPTIDLPSHWQVAVGEMEVRDHVDRLLSEAADRRLIMVDDAAGLADMGLPMAQLADGCDGGRQRMLATMEDTKARSGFDVLARTLRAPRFGLLLRPNPIDDKDVFGLPLPRVKSHLWPAGRGYVIDDQSVELIQVAYPN